MVGRDVRLGVMLSDITRFLTLTGCHHIFHISSFRVIVY